MIYLLDTNTCIRYLNGSSAKVTNRLQAISPDDIAICSIVKAEMFYGARRSSKPAQTRAAQEAFLSQFASLPFDDNAADAYSQIRAQLAVLGTPIGPNDMMIAAIALVHNLIAVTHNTREYKRVAGLVLEDWEL